MRIKVSEKRNNLRTRFSDSFDKENCWQQHPRPQAMRPLYKSLNGVWEFDFIEHENEIASPPPFLTALKREIVVPFPWESRLSGICEMNTTGRAYYRKLFAIPSEMLGKRILLHFDAVDWECEVFLNGKSMCVHRGGYDPFVCDITQAINNDKDQELFVKVYDPTRGGLQPTGKQMLERFNDPRGCMYEPCSGIWQPVWLEATAFSYIESFTITPDMERSCFTVNTQVHFASSLKNTHIQILVYDEGNLIAGIQGKVDESIHVQVPSMIFWSPENPHLYTIKIRLMSTTIKIIDEIETYSAIRTVTLVEDKGVKKIALNGKPFFQMGTLDQGYWPEGIYTPPTDEAQRWDISEMKRLGFNMIRKHAKVENFRWYYWCDVLGMVVWQDMPSSFGTKKEQQEGDNQAYGNDDSNKEEAREQFRIELLAMLKTHINIPSIIIWTVFNEGWGEFNTIEMTQEVMDFDPSRLVIPNSGCNCSTDIEAGHILDLHNYLPPVCPPPSDARAIVCGEYGSLGFIVPGNMYHEEGPYHGMVCNDIEDATIQYEVFVKTIMDMRDKQGLCAAVYTQWTDVENEINGIYSYDRVVLKIKEDTLIACNKNLTDE